MEHFSYEVVGFFIQRDAGEILVLFDDVGLTVETISVRMTASGEDIVIEAT